MERTSKRNNNNNGHDPHLDHYVVHPVSRAFAEEFISADALRQLDEAKARLAESVGVRKEHIRLSIEMLVVVET